MDTGPKTVKLRLINLSREFASQNSQIISVSKFHRSSGCFSLLQRLKYKVPVVYAMHDGQDLKHPLGYVLYAVDELLMYSKSDT